MEKYPSYDDKLLSLRRIEGQVRGVQRMIEGKQYCIDILVQIQAVMGALAKVGDGILEKHLEHCVAKAVKGKSLGDRQKKFRELVDVIHRFRKI